MQYVWNGEIRARERPDQNKRREKREKMRDVWIWTVIENNHFVLLSSSPSVCFIDGHCLNRYNWIMGTLGKAPSHPDRGEGAILQHSLNPAAVWDRSHQSYQLCEQWKKEEIFCLSHSQKHKRFVWGFVQTHIWHCYLRRGILLFYHLFSPKMRKIMCSVTKTKKKKKTHQTIHILIMQAVRNEENRLIAAVNSSSPWSWQSDNLQAGHLACKHTSVQSLETTKAEQTWLMETKPDPARRWVDVLWGWRWGSQCNFSRGLLRLSPGTGGLVDCAWVRESRRKPKQQGFSGIIKLLMRLFRRRTFTVRALWCGAINDFYI